MTAPHSLAYLADIHPDPLWVFDRRHRLTGWNRAAGRLYGPRSAAVVGQSVLLFVPTDGEPGFHRACQATYDTGAWAGDLLTRTAAGEPRLVAARWVLTGPADDPDAQVLAAHTAVTDRRGAEAATARAARWSAARAVAAAVAAEPADRCGDWLPPVGRFAAAGEPEAAGTGDVVLVAAASPTARELTRVLMSAAGYAPVTATDGREAVLALAGTPGRVRAAVVGLGPDTAAAAAELRRLRPDLPVVPLDPAADPGRLLAAVAAG